MQSCSAQVVPTLWRRGRLARFDKRAGGASLDLEIAAEGGRMKTKNSVVVITGASSGIGRATALEFARKGAYVVAGARREEALRRLESEAGSLRDDLSGVAI